MELIDEIRSSRRVGYRRVDPNRGTWEDMGIEVALRQPSLLLRFRKTMDFVRNTAPLETLRQARILDAGEPNPFSTWLERVHAIRVVNTPPDLDFDYSASTRMSGEPFRFIFAFEIFEHLMNPLIFLEFLRNQLQDEGRLFLSTPFVRPRFLWSQYHITEYFPDKVEEIAAKAGFEVLRYDRVNVYPLRSGLLGIRPLFRLWFERIMLFELRKVPRAHSR